jgi:predicted nucleotidyltransferase
MLTEGDRVLDHHRATIDRAVEHFRARDDVLAVLVGGSIAHGFATATSDVDLLLLVSDADWERRLADGVVTELDLESPTYDGGYVDAKYMSMGFLRDVAARGSEPARFAFDGVIVAWSRLGGLDEAIQAAARYPVEGREERIRAFHAQLSYWHWMAREADRTGNAWLRGLAGPNVVIFAARLILAHNAVLYPGFKWLLRVLHDVPGQPPGLGAAIGAVIADPGLVAVDALVTCVREFRDWGVDPDAWGARFMLDTELAWIHGRPAIADL